MPVGVGGRGTGMSWEKEGEGDIFVISCGHDQRGNGENSRFSLLSCG